MTDVPGSVPVAGARPMLGRTSEMDALEDVVGSVRGGRGRALTIVGDAGLGKTALLDRVAEIATGCRVVRLAGSPVERELTWAGLYELSRPLLRHRTALSRPARDALSAALGLDGPAAASPDLLAVGHATLQLAAAAAEQEPVIIVVDDVQWLDTGSRAVFGFVARRLEAEAVGIVFASRPPVPADLSDVPRVDLHPLDHSDALQLVTTLGAAVRDDVAEQLVGVAGGNPLALHELTRNLTAAQLRGEEDLPQVLPAGSAPEAVFGPALAGLPPATAEALLVVASARTDRLTHVLEVLARLGLGVHDLEAAEPALVTLSSGKVRFLHPLARTAVYERARPSERRRVHRAHADVLPPDAWERRAWHLASAAVDRDEEAAEAMAAVAAAASARGAHATASRASEEAARLDPLDDRAVGHLLHAAAAAVHAEAVQRAQALARQATEQTTDPVSLARAAQITARAKRLAGAEGSVVSPLVEAAATVSCLDPELAMGMLLDAVTAASASARPATALPVAVAADQLRREHPSCARFEIHTALALGIGHVAAGDTAAGLARLQRHAELGLDDGDRFTDDRLLLAVASMLTWAGDYAGAEAALHRCIEVGKRRPHLLPDALLALATVEFRTGRWVAAADAAQRALLVARAVDKPRSVVAALLSLGLVRACQGRTEAADLVDRARTAGSEASTERVRRHAAVVRANLALSLGRPAEAVEHLEDLDPDEAGNPAANLAARDLIEAMILAGDADRASEQLDSFCARARSSGSRRAMSAAARLRGMVERDPAVADCHFREAVELASADVPFTLALAELRWGTRLAGDGRTTEARELLDRAWDRFVALDAPGWLHQTAAALRSAGATPDPVPQTPPLTAEERVLADAVAAGSSVGRIADSLLISTRTAEDRLGSALEKLGTPSRDALLSPSPDDDGPGPYRCRMLGRFEVLRDDQDVTPPPGVLATCVQLVALRGSVHVEELLEELWPGVDPARGRTRLRNVLARIRRASGDLLVRRGDLIELSPDAVVDVRRFEAAADAALGGDDDAVATALGAYGGTLLPESLYLQAATVTRERLRRRRVELLDLAARQAEAGGRVDDAVRHLRAAIDDEPYDENRYLAVARLLGPGRRGAALDVLEQAKRMLDELGLEPSAAWREAVCALRAA